VAKDIMALLSEKQKRTSLLEQKTAKLKKLKSNG
jgi:hypothetical protein